MGVRDGTAMTKVVEKRFRGDMRRIAAVPQFTDAALDRDFNVRLVQVTLRLCSVHLTTNNLN